jgi:hypothetical protein
MKAAVAAAFLVLVTSDSLAALRRPVPGPVPQRGEIGGLVHGRAQALYCGNIGFVDLGAAVDGPAYYFSRSDGRVIGRCGGYLRTPEGRRSGARVCPPRSWTCRSR